MDLVDVATLLHLYVVSNLPLASATFAIFTMFIAFDMFPSAIVHVLLIVMLLLDVLVHEQLDFFMSR